MLVLIWVQTVCKGYQQTTKITISMEKSYTCSTEFGVFILFHFLQGLKTTLRVMDEECPREENSISNRQLLVKELHIEKIMKRNKASLFCYSQILSVHD